MTPLFKSTNRLICNPYSRRRADEISTVWTEHADTGDTKCISQDFIRKFWQLR